MLSRGIVHSLLPRPHAKWAVACVLASFPCNCKAPSAAHQCRTRPQAACPSPQADGSTLFPHPNIWLCRSRACKTACRRRQAGPPGVARRTRGRLCRLPVTARGLACSSR
eukprot:365219-Chlamydomonas_euryale.AAC.55